MKKTLSIITAIILTVALLLSFAACNKNKTDGKDGDSAKQTETTAVGKYIDVEIDYASFKENEKLMYAFLDNKDLHFKTLSEGFGMGDEIANQFYETPEEFYVYTYNLTIFNSGNLDVAVYDIICKNNVKDNVFVNTYNAFGAVYNIGVGSECGATIAVICNNPDLTDAETCEIVDSMEFEVVCSKVPREYDDGTESVEETKYIKAYIDDKE